LTFSEGSRRQRVHQQELRAAISLRMTKPKLSACLQLHFLEHAGLQQHCWPNGATAVVGQCWN
jgi:hypothetical protein